MFPPFLPDYVVNLTLQYLLPPSGPLPPHLISKQSLQRHHFLDIDPADSESYFCWPASSSDQSAALVIRALELLAGNEELLEKQDHDVKYDADEETKRARVQIGNDVQLIFLWQDAEEMGGIGGESGWRYHDAKFAPVNSESEADSTLEMRVDDRPLNRPPASHEAALRSSSPSSDSYWDNYGTSSSQHSPHARSSLQLPKGSAHGQSVEDAYWNSYASVHGTADSTIPSPHVENRNSKQPHYPTQPQYPADPDFERTRETQEEGEHDGYFPPTERVLRAFVPPPSDVEGGYDATSHAERLAQALFPVLSLQDYSETNAKENGNTATNDVVDDDDNTAVPAKCTPKPSGGLLSPPLSSETGSDEAPTTDSNASAAASPSRLGFDPATRGDTDMGVAECVRGLFKLWVSRRQPSPSTEENLRKEFVGLVENALS